VRDQQACEYGKSHVIAGGIAGLVVDICNAQTLCPGSTKQRDPPTEETHRRAHLSCTIHKPQLFSCVSLTHCCLHARSVSPTATQSQSEPEASAGRVPAVARLRRNDFPAPGGQNAQTGCRERQHQGQDQTTRGETCTRSSEQSDSGKSAEKERRQRYRERYPPPPGPPPSPTPSRRRRKTSPNRRASPRSRQICEPSTGESEEVGRESVVSLSPEKVVAQLQGIVIAEGR